MKSFLKLLEPPVTSINAIESIIIKEKIKKKKYLPIAIAEDEAFHFKYPETREFLEAIGIEVLPWRIIDNESLPKGVNGLIIPGGFPENHAERISSSRRSLASIRDAFNKYPIYAECGGMLILGENLKGKNGKQYEMAKLLPFKAERGDLNVGYRKMKGINNGLIIDKGIEIMGHEFHHWKINQSIKRSILLREKEQNLKEGKLKPPWQISCWGKATIREGWSNKLFHASWVHLHIPSCISKINLLNNLQQEN